MDNDLDYTWEHAKRDMITGAYYTLVGLGWIVAFYYMVQL